jgi:hypothetical protein
VTGVFGVLAKLAPVHFSVDQEAWRAWRKEPGAPSPALNCAPLVAVRTMKGAAGCHMCGRCSGYKGAVRLARRSPMHEIVHVAGLEARPWETALIVFGLMGVAAGAFHWASSAVFVAVKQAVAERLVDLGAVWALEQTAPWWILTNYPDQNDVMTVLDGAVLVGFILAVAMASGAAIYACLALAARALGPWSARRFHHLAQALIPIAGCGVFLGLSALTVTMLRHEGFELGFVGPLRAALLAGASLWSLALAWGVSGLATVRTARRVLALAPFAAAVGVGAASWASLFWRF